MIIGKFDINGRKHFTINTINLENLMEQIYDYYFERHHIIIKCKKCGNLLAPCIEHVGPKGCGWKKGKHKGWYCHQCSYHNGGFWDGSEEDRKEFLKECKERNTRTKQELVRYKMTHPWVRYKKI